MAAVAWLTVQDALRLNGLVPKETVRGVGLRRGRFVGVFHPESSVVTVDLDGARFTRDVAVDGRQAGLPSGQRGWRESPLAVRRAPTGG